MTLRIGVLGASRIADLAIVGPAQQLGHRLVAVAARDRGRAELFAEKHGVERVLASYADVVDDPEVNAIYNPLANSLHAPWNLAAIAAGKPVLTEKPFARNRSEAQQVAEAAHAAGVTVMEGFHYLFHPVTRRAFELAVDGTIGEMHHVEVRMAMPAPGRLRPAMVTRAGRRRADGSGLLRPARHAQASATRRSSVLTPRNALPGVDEWCDVELRLSRRSDRPERQHDGGPRPFVHPAHRRHQGRSVGAQLHQAARGRPADHPDAGGHPGGAPRHPDRRTAISWRRSPRTCCTARALPIDTADAVENMAYVDAAYRAAGMTPR